jgi:hypothetical protein
MLDHAIKASSKMPRTAKKEKVQNLRRGSKFQNAMLAGEAALDALLKFNSNK